MISYTQMLAELQNFCSQSQTGTVLISTAGGSTGKFGLVNGKITGVMFANQRGLHALDLVKSCSNVDLSFWKGKSIVPADADLPLTSEILTALKNGAVTNRSAATPAAKPNNNSAPYDGDAERGTAPAPGSDNRLPGPADLRVILETELTRSIGPVASVYIERYAAQINSVRTYQQLVQLLRTLAGKAVSQQTASEFVERVLANIRSS
jgi:hypothetical protein